jgi:hypothetical protein
MKIILLSLAQITPKKTHINFSVITVKAVGHSFTNTAALYINTCRLLRCRNYVTNVIILNIYSHKRSNAETWIFFPLRPIWLQSHCINSSTRDQQFTERWLGQRTTMWNPRNSFVLWRSNSCLVCKKVYDLFQNILAMRVPLTSVCACACVCVFGKAVYKLPEKPYTKSAFQQPVWCCDQPTVRQNKTKYRP